MERGADGTIGPGHSGARGAVLVMDAGSVRDWAEECVLSLRHLRADIDGMNVYPVADSDTGSNLLTTVLGAREALGDAAGGAGPALTAFAGGAVRSARGNSGVILAQVLRGIAESVGEDAEVDSQGFAHALGHADRVATAAVARPVEGTMLSVLHAAAGAARDAEAARLSAVAEAAAGAAARALERTPDQLPVLAQAGVVDAGGRGLAAVLDALVTTLSGDSGRGRDGAPPPAEAADEADPVDPVDPVDEVAGPARVPAWEVMYLLGELGRANLAALRGKLAELGESVSIAEDGAGTHAVHVHCADIGAAIEAGLAFGTPHHVKVEPLLRTRPAAAAGERSSRGVVVLVHGDALAEIAGREGVSVLRVPAGVRPSTAELLGLIADAADDHVTVLPAGPDLTETAEQTAAEIAGHGVVGARDVVVVPCASPVQVLAALAVHDPSRRAGDDVVAMAEAAAATRRGELRIATEESLTWVGTAPAGAVVGLVDGEVVLIGADPASDVGLVGAAVQILGRMLALGGELVTVLTGARAPQGIEAELETWVADEHPEAELVCYPGGQDDAVLLIGVE